ncbi:MAG: RagB/SusD family nutrient uptake outer membrane protein [Prevotellaceae bacterium]|jgi:hypothetical protein|nr:RagB/SusD family nutrient uptake outer membrane protein [Prevotellaceae bacterium]
MKKILFTWFFIAGLLFCNSACDLNEFPEDTASSVAIFGSAKGLELYANSFYDILPGPGSGVFAVDNNSDIVARQGVDVRFSPNALNSTTSSGWSWGDLRNLNFFIENCEKSSVPEKNHYLGLAHFFRAYFYFEKVKRFGDVPWIEKVIEVDDDATLYGTRDSRFEVMERVLADLNYAIDNISLTNDPTRTLITKNVARAYKTRICLYEASLRKYHTRYGQQATANDWYREVVRTANEITGFSLHQGSSAYRDLFIQKVPFTDETILCIALNADLKVYSSINRSTISPTYGDRPCLTRRFVNTYLNLDGTSFTDYQMPFASEVKNRDTRLKQTIRLGDYKRTENGVPVAAPPNLDQSYTGYQIIKGCYDERFPYDDENLNDNAHIIMRWAEVLLNKAEALAELGEMNNTEWAATIGALRARAGITGATLTNVPVVADPYMLSFYLNKFTDPVLLEIFRERAVELVLEGRRPDDLVRWHVGELFAEAPMNGMYVPALGDYDLNEDGKMDVCFYQGTRPSSSASVFINVSAGQSRTLADGASGDIIYFPGEREWAERKYLYPIPEADRVKNPALGQNPGWSEE